jgi:prepilin-type N-terminal cleavage/methylation domain-containing protein
MRRMLSTRTKRGRSQAGVTLVELLVSMVILSVITTMVIVVWIALQSSYAQSANANDARSTARDALNRTATEIRDAQPRTITTPAQAPFTMAQPMEVDFYSSYNQPGTAADGSATGTLRLTRIYLDTSGSSPYKTLYWQRDTNNNGTWDSGDRLIVLASNVVNNAIPNTAVTPNTSYTAIFIYGYRDPNGNFLTADTISAANLSTIVSVNIRLMVDVNLNHTPTRADLQITVRPRNAPQS